MRFSTFELQWRIRPGGGGRTERRYLDFIIDGQSLHERLEPRDHVTGLGCWVAEFELVYIQQLLARVTLEPPAGRAPIYVCGECGDLGCGAITAIVERTTKGFVWRDFAFENNYDSDMTDLDAYRGVGPFLFNKTVYWQVLKERASALDAA